jgi:hypothetical protein
MLAAFDSLACTASSAADRARHPFCLVTSAALAGAGRLAIWRLHLLLCAIVCQCVPICTMCAILTQMRRLRLSAGRPSGRVAAWHRHLAPLFAVAGLQVARPARGSGTRDQTVAESEHGRQCRVDSLYHSPSTCTKRRYTYPGEALQLYSSTSKSPQGQTKMM